MRRSLVWALAASAALAAVTLWVPQKATTIVQAIESRRGTNDPPLLGDGMVGQGMLPLPQALESLVIETARRDPFAEGPTAPSLVAKVTVPPAPTSPTPSVPVLSAPPPMTWRLLGTMDSPDGERKVLLVPANEAQVVAAAPGVQLSGGYEVVDIAADAVRLVHPSTRTEVVIPILPPPLDGR